MKTKQTLMLIVLSTFFLNPSFAKIEKFTITINSSSTEKKFTETAITFMERLIKNLKPQFSNCKGSEKPDYSYNFMENYFNLYSELSRIKGEGIIQRCLGYTDKKGQQTNARLYYIHPESQQEKKSDLSLYIKINSYKDKQKNILHVSVKNEFDNVDKALIKAFIGVKDLFGSELDQVILKSMDVKAYAVNNDTIEINGTYEMYGNNVNKEKVDIEIDKFKNATINILETYRM